MHIEIVDKKRFTLLVGAIMVLIAASVFFGTKFLKKNSKIDIQESPTLYEALVQPFNQGSGNSEVEKDTSALEKGDVVVVFPEGHPWSETEKTSYPILKLKITQEEVSKLLEPIDEKAEANDKNKNQSSRKKIIRARKYRLRIENLGFDIQKFWENPVQPYADKIFDNSLIEEKT